LPTSTYEEIKALPEPERSARALLLITGVFDRFGLSSKDAAATIIDGVKAKKTRFV
jgi:hypothetical protein